MRSLIKKFKNTDEGIVELYHSIDEGIYYLMRVSDCMVSQDFKSADLAVNTFIGNKIHWE